MANVILKAWRAGVKHKIRLANYGIGSVEKKLRKQIIEASPFLEVVFRK